MLSEFKFLATESPFHNEFECLLFGFIRHDHAFEVHFLDVDHAVQDISNKILDGHLKSTMSLAAFGMLLLMLLLI